MLAFALFVAGVGVVFARAADTATQPTQSDLDYLLSQSKVLATQPADPAAGSATRPLSPFRSDQLEGLRLGTLILSDGKKMHGAIGHTERKPLRVWVEKDKEYTDVPFVLVRSIDASVVWERDEPEWHFKESGSDVKEYSGKTYPAREMRYVITLESGKTIAGGVVEPLYLQTQDGPVTYALHKRDKGDLGQTLDQLVYVKHVDFENVGGTTRPAE